MYVFHSAHDKSERLSSETNKTRLSMWNNSAVTPLGHRKVRHFVGCRSKFCWYDICSCFAVKLKLHVYAIDFYIFKYCFFAYGVNIDGIDRGINYIFSLPCELLKSCILRQNGFSYHILRKIYSTHDMFLSWLNVFLLAISIETFIPVAIPVERESWQKQAWCKQIQQVYHLNPESESVMYIANLQRTLPIN